MGLDLSLSTGLGPLHCPALLICFDPRSCCLCILTGSIGVPLMSAWLLSLHSEALYARNALTH